MEEKYIKRNLLLASGWYWFAILLFLWTIIASWVLIYLFAAQKIMMIADEVIKIAFLICIYWVWFMLIKFMYTSSIIGFAFIKQLASERQEHLPNQTEKFVKLLLLGSFTQIIIVGVIFFLFFKEQCLKMFIN